MCKLARFTFTTFWSVATLLLAARTVPAADIYTIDPAHTSIVFSVAHSGLSYTYGFFREASGTYLIDKSNLDNSRFRLVIKANSLDTNNLKRDTHLRGPDYFDVQQFPDITFESIKCVATKTQDGGALFQLTGKLTMHGVTLQIDNIPLRMLGEGEGPYKDHRSGFLCQIELKRSEFGMSYLVKEKLVGDAVGITVSFEGVLQEQPAAAPRTQ